MASRYLLDELPGPGTWRLPDALAHHVGRVLRARPGDEMVLCDGRGGECTARLVSVSGRLIEAEVGPRRAVQRALATRIELAFALPRGARAEWLFEHATELGAAAFRPLVSAHAAVRPGHERAERWQRVVRAAAGQCGLAHLPALHPFATVEQLLADAAALPGERYLAEPGAPPLGPAHGGHALLAVGPPGGFAASEVEALRAAGFAARGLGPLTLRTETAVLAGLVRLLAGAAPDRGHGIG
jgi:16S rRNA (uracil1498-N3)-methyltransferase